MDLLEQISPQTVLFFLLFGGAAVTALILCLYLLLRRGNAIAADIQPPMRLRRWAAAFFGIVAAGHIWWILFYLYSNDFTSWVYVVLSVLDSLTILTTLFGTLLSMLQDRSRPLWPFLTALTPIVVLGGLQIAWPDTNLITPFIVYVMAVYLFFTIYMIRAIRQYSRWLRDNYSDLEHKEMRQSHTLLIFTLIVLVNYGFLPDTTSLFFIRFTDFLLFGLLLWRVETLPQLETAAVHQEESLPLGQDDREPAPELSQELVSMPHSNISELLSKHCEQTGLYLQHDLNLAQLAAAIGVNRLYLSQYFSRQDTNYNTYINGLRINNFISLYREAVATNHPFTLQQLARKSGYRSYSTFSLAFKQRMGQSVTAWKQEVGDNVGDNTGDNVGDNVSE